LRLEPPAQEVGTREKLVWEKELLGLYVSSHPLDDYNDWLLDHCRPLELVKPEADGRSGRVGGLITSVRRINTKKGDLMAFVQLEDATGTAEMIVFPKVYEASPHLFEEDKVLVASIKISARDRDGNLSADAKLMAESVQEMDHGKAVAYKATKMASETKGGTVNSAAASVTKLGSNVPPARTASPAVVKPTRALVVRLSNPADPAQLLALKGVLGAHSGDSSVFALLGDADPKRILLPFKVMLSDEILVELKELLGDGRVEVEAN
jgi:DNA polymerase III subunit alpha